MTAPSRPPGRRRRLRTSIERWIALLVILNFVVVGILLLTVVLDQVNGHPAQAQVLPTATPGPSASLELMPMGLAHIPTSNACVLCHDGGGSGGVKVVPAIGHPLEGWRSCTVCHTNDKLGRTAAGHEGIAESECLNCHKEAKPGPAITQPHSKLQGQHCLDCHGTFAHLPASMASRDESSCTLCHKPTALPPPTFDHPQNPRLACRDCHQSVEVGNLPIDHALRADDTCLLCHLIKGGGSPTLPAPSTLTPPPSQVPAPTLGTG